MSQHINVIIEWFWAINTIDYQNSKFYIFSQFFFLFPRVKSILSACDGIFPFARWEQEHWACYVVIF